MTTAQSKVNPRLAHALSSGRRGKRGRSRATDPVAVLLAGDAGVVAPEHMRRGDPRALVKRYLEDCALRGVDEKHIIQKRGHLRKFISEAGNEWRTSTALLRSMRTLTQAGRSVRTANFRRQIVRAWGNWCVKNGLLDAHPYTHTPPLDGRADKRYVRRALTDDECDRLLAHARTISAERHALYACAIYAGLRRSELFKIRWKSVCFDEGVLVIEDGKSGRVDQVPIAPPLAEALRAMEGRGANERVFPRELTQDERKADYEASGIALVDDRGRIADLHSLRRTLHMRLVRSGVQPQVAQRIMRHSDYRTTLTHYTDGLVKEAADAMAGAFASREPAGSSALAAWLDACPVQMRPEVRRLVEMVAASAG